MRGVACFCKFFILFLFIFPEVSAQQDSAIPNQSEGIYAFLRRNNREGQGYYKEFLKLNQKKLAKNQSLKMGESYILPTLKGSAAVSNKSATVSNKSAGKPENVKQLSAGKSTPKKMVSVYEPLFGLEQSHVKVTSNLLSDACFYVVGEHGGPDPGAICLLNGHELHEDEYAYDVALRLSRQLMSLGATVRIIIQDAEDGIRSGRYLDNSKRETCIGDPIPLNQLDRLQQRCNKINTLYAIDRKNFNYCRAIFIHVDSRKPERQLDVFFYHHDASPKSIRLAETMNKTFESRYARYQPNRGFTGTLGPRDLFVLENSNPPGVLVELGNFHNNKDQQRIIMSLNRQTVALWFADGFVKDHANKK